MAGKAEVMVELAGLTKRFDGTTAVEDLTLRVRGGEIFGLLGPNGAGKTTTVRMLCCLLRPTSGTAFVGGHEIGRESMRIREITGLLPENPGLYPELSAYRNLDFYARLYGVPEARKRRNIEELLRMVGLWGRRDEPIGRFSKGMQQKIAIIRAMVHEPDVLFLDEPTASLSPDAAKIVRDFVLELKRERRTIVMCTHNLYEAERLCDRVAILNTRLVAVGSTRELERQFGRSKTEIHLEGPARRFVRALKRVRGVGRVSAEGNRLLVEVEDPDRVNPSMVSAVVRAGGRIRYVTRPPNVLEEVYLRLVGRNEER
ncbi:MAG: ABC transporter ATP-binding protein [Candidatus Hadarchaeales archaeon]